jgi:hypothetical protein
LERLLRAVGWNVETFASAQEFLAHRSICPLPTGANGGFVQAIRITNAAPAASWRARKR